VPAPTGTVTFLFTDIEGSTRLWEKSPSAMRGALERHDEIVRGAIDRERGYLFATGGHGFAAAFERVGAATVLPRGGGTGPRGHRRSIGTPVSPAETSQSLAIAPLIPRRRKIGLRTGGPLLTNSGP